MPRSESFYDWQMTWKEVDMKRGWKEKVLFRVWKTKVKENINWRGVWGGRWEQPMEVGEARVPVMMDREKKKEQNMTWQKRGGQHCSLFWARNDPRAGTALWIAWGEEGLCGDPRTCCLLPSRVLRICRISAWLNESNNSASMLFLS